MNKLSKINFVSRIGLAFIFFYHGFFPKIFLLSAIEIELVDLHHSGISAQVLSPIAGLFEIALAAVILFQRKTLIPIYLAGGLLTATYSGCGLYKTLFTN